MTTILGIDVAWTATQPSGVALVSSIGAKWRLIFAGSSYSHLLAEAEKGLVSTSWPSGSIAEAKALLTAAREITGTPVDLGAVHRAAGFRQFGFVDPWRPSLQHAYAECDHSHCLNSFQSSMF